MWMKGALLAREILALTFFFEALLQEREPARSVRHAEPEYTRRAARRKCSGPFHP